MPYGGAGGQRLIHTVFIVLLVAMFKIFTFTTFITMLSLINFLWNLLFAFVFLFKIPIHSISSLVLKALQKKYNTHNNLSIRDNIFSKEQVMGHGIHIEASVTM